MRVRQHVYLPIPPRGDYLCRPGCQRDQRLSCGDKHVLLLGVRIGLDVVRVAQIVHGVDERFVVHLQFLHDLGEHRRANGVKAEVHVKHIEPMVVFPDPLRIEHQGRPPAAGHLAAVGGDRIAKARHRIESAGI